MEKTLFDFMREAKTFEFDDSVFCGRHTNRLIWESGKLFFHVGKTNKMYQIKRYDDLMNFYEKDTGLAVRVCTVCGSPMQSGYTDDGGWAYCCSDECFKKDMDERYGEGKWRKYEDKYEKGAANEWGGYYEYLDKNGVWQPEPSYYTEW